MYDEKKIFSTGLTRAAKAGNRNNKPNEPKEGPLSFVLFESHLPQFQQSSGAAPLLCMGQIAFVLFSALWTVVLYTHRKIAKLSHSAVDRHCFDADPDPEPNFHFDAIQIRIRIWTSIKTMPILMRILPQVLHIRIRIFLLFVIALPLYFVFYISHQCQMCRMFSVFWTAY